MNWPALNAAHLPGETIESNSIQLGRLRSIGRNPIKERGQAKTMSQLGETHSRLLTRSSLMMKLSMLAAVAARRVTN